MQNTASEVVRRATAADLPAIQRFVSETYEETAPFKNEARWRWQFEDMPQRPAGDSGPAVWIAEAEGRVAGQIAVQDGAIWLGDQRFDAGWIVDVMVHPDFRGRGLGHKIHAAVAEDRETVITLTMADATRRMAEKYGCVTLGETQYYARPTGLKGRTLARFLAHRTAHRASRARLVKAFNATGIGPALLAGAIGLKAGRLPCVPDAEIDEISTFSPEIETFWQETRPAFPALFDRSAEWLNWRFNAVPGLAYRRFVLRRDGVVKGYLVTRVGDPAELPLGVIVDVFAHPDDTETLDALIAHGCAVLAPECEFIEGAASTPSFHAAFKRAGFMGGRRHFPTVVTSNPDVEAFAKAHPDDWHFSKADHDWDQVHPV